MAEYSECCAANGHELGAFCRQISLKIDLGQPCGLTGAALLIPVNFLPRRNSYCAVIDLKTLQDGRHIMFIDEVVIAGVAIVGLCIVFCTGFGLFIWKDAQKGRK